MQRPGGGAEHHRLVGRQGDALTRRAPGGGGEGGVGEGGGEGGEVGSEGVRVRLTVLERLAVEHLEEEHEGHAVAGGEEDGIVFEDADDAVVALGEGVEHA